MTYLQLLLLFLQAVLAYRDILEQVSEEFAGPAAAVLKLL